MKLFDARKEETGELFRMLRSRTQRVSDDITDKVRGVIDAVRGNGDAALYRYSMQFDGVSLGKLELTEEERAAAVARVSPALYETMKRAAENIRTYHKCQLTDGYEFTADGKTLGRVVRPLERVGVYVPGGSAAYPSTVLMNCIPAKVAGVSELILVTPPKEDGIHPAIAAAAEIAGVDRIFTVGGAQAVAALAYGTESIPQVDKIVGPGNMFVAEAKRQVFGTVAIDMVAGPSEVLIIADASAKPEYVAADLLSQLEHDPSASAVLLTTERSLAEAVNTELNRQLDRLPRKDIAGASLADYSATLLVRSLTEAVGVANRVAPEHLEIMTEDPYILLPKIENAGSVFLGEYAPEPMGDYFAGANHVLPTNGTARFSSPLSVDDFVKKMSYLCYTEEAFRRDAEDVIRFAEAEGLGAHANSVRIRRNEY